MKRTSIFDRQRSGLELKMTPMIDVVFLLLVYFIWTASFQVLEYTLPSSLSEITGGQSDPTVEIPPPEKEFDDVVIKIRYSQGQPSWEVNEQLLPSLAAVGSQLRVIHQIKSDAPVVVDPDAAVPFGDVVSVYDVARLVGFAKVGLAVSEGVAQ